MGAGSGIKLPPHQRPLLTSLWKQSLSALQAFYIFKQQQQKNHFVSQNFLVDCKLQAFPDTQINPYRSLEGEQHGSTSGEGEGWINSK